MFRLLIVASLATVMIGCGGGSGSSSTTTTGGGGGGGRVYPTFNLGTGALMQTVFLSGQGRTLPRGRGAGASQVAVVRDVKFQNSAFDFIPAGDGSQGDEVRVQLDGYTINSKAFGVSFGFGNSERTFLEFPLEIAQFLEVQSDGTTTPLTPPDSTAFTPPEPFDCKVRLYPGRISTLTVRLDDSMVGWNTGTNTASFNPDIFVAGNYNPIYNAMVSQFSDYVAFDISNVDDRPDLSISGDLADRVYFSGDGYAMSSGLGQTSEFELLDPIVVQNGKVNTGPLIGPNGQQIPGANLFILEDTGPDTSRFTSVIGTWRSFETVINSASADVAVAFPKTLEDSEFDEFQSQQFVMYRASGNQVTELWYGTLFFSTNTFKMYPVSTIDDAVPSQEVNGSVSNLVTVNGKVRRGDWNVTGTPPASWPFGSTGGFGVFRR